MQEKNPGQSRILCADENMKLLACCEHLLKRRLFGKSFSKSDTILLNSKDSLPGTREISRRRCSNVIKNIVQQNYKRTSERENIVSCHKG